MTTITQKSFGKTSTGREAYLFTFVNKNGAEVSITNQGGAIVSIKVPDKSGVLADVALGYESAADYEVPGRYIGALIGRHGNRIEDSKFELNGKTYELFPNDGRNNLHGGKVGFDKKFWESKVEGDKLYLTYVSEDGEEGFPGKLTATVCYTFDDENALKIEYSATADADTVCNLTNHVYFNLKGHNTGDILNHEVKIYAHKYTEGNDECLPTGVISTVEGTPLDFLDYHKVGERIGSDFYQITAAGGYDHNWVLDGEGFRLIAEVKEETSGRHMEVYTNMPGVQFYTGNFMNSEEPCGKDKAIYRKRNGLCLETQFFPNSLKHTHFPSPILRKGDTYHHVVVYKFDTL